tara:strand:- start:13737 stop:14510 length:774 start_codon:yes stop_codon:yes gene_type:complete
MGEVANTLREIWRNTSIEKNDTVLIHCNLTKFYRYFLKRKIKITDQDIIDSLLSAVGTEGTLLFPTFNFTFTSGGIFDPFKTKSQMSGLSDYAISHKDSYRTLHPVYSFAIIGKNKNNFNKDNYSAYGKDSPFGMLKKNNAKILIVNLDDQKSMTYYHHVEEMLDVKYRFHKHFKCKIKNNEKIEDKKFSIFVRNIKDGIKTDVNRMGDKLQKLGLYKNFTFERNHFRLINANDVFNETEKVILNKKEIDYLYSVYR